MNKFLLSKERMMPLLKKTIYLSTALSVLLFTNDSYSQISGSWEDKANMPTARKELSDAVTILDGKIYALGGRTAGSAMTNTFERYDPATDSWANLAPYPLSVWRISTEAFNGKIYAFGGYLSINNFPFTPSNQAFVYDPATDNWMPIQIMLSTRGSASSIVLDGKIHLIGGANNDALNTHHVYDPITDSWSVLSAMAVSRSGLTSAVINNKIYAIGGYNLSAGFVSLGTAEMYDPITDSWSFISNLPFAKFGTTSAVVQNKLFVFGNTNNANVLSYDPINNSWQELGAMPENVNFAGAVQFNDVIYVIGGGTVDLIADGIGDVNCFSPMVTGVNDFELNNLLIYPNPSNGKVSVQSDIEVAAINILDINGRLLNKYRSFKNQNNIELNIGDEKGIYFINIEFNNGQKIFRKLMLK